MQTEAVNRSVLFLPGAGGDGNFWQGVGSLLPVAWEKTYLDWPGLGNQPPRPGMDSLDSLAGLEEAALQRPSVVVAQSMGGIVALKLALRHPERVTHLVLTVTSGGLDMAGLGAADWRPVYLSAFPNTATWILHQKPDLSAELPGLDVPVLLLWGDSDPISPPAVGHRLAGLLPHARLEILPGGAHSLGMDMPDRVAALIAGFLAGAGPQEKGMPGDQSNPRY